MTLLGLPDGAGNSWFGQLLLICGYCGILYKAAVLIGDVSERLLLIYGPGIVGGLLIPILRAIPIIAIVLASGLGSNAQCQLSTGVGTLAGSTIMLLTIAWTLSLFLGCRDKDAITGCAASEANGRPKYVEGFRPLTSCVTTYKNTVSGAQIMVASSATYLTVLIPAIIDKKKSTEMQITEEHYPSLVGFIVSAVAYIVYSLFEIVDSRAQTVQELQATKLRFNEWKQSVQMKTTSTDIAMKMAFNKYDKDGNGLIDKQELHDMFKELGLDLHRVNVDRLMSEAQQDDDIDTMTLKEFSDAVKKWSLPILTTQTQLMSINEVDETMETPKRIKTYQNIIDIDDDEKDEEEDEATDEEKEKLIQDMWSELNMENEDEEDEEEEAVYIEEKEKKKEKQSFLYSICPSWCLWILNYPNLLRVTIGLLLYCIFSEALVSVIVIFSNTLGISSFYVSFIVTPIACNAANIHSLSIFSNQKTKEGISMRFSALYDAICVNNTCILCIFCALVFFRRLYWTFIGETFVILITVIIVGINGMKQTVTVWQGFIAIALYPISLILVAVLDPFIDDVNKC